MKNDQIGIALIGCGRRGYSVTKNCLTPRDDIRILYVCDGYPDRQEELRKLVEERSGYSPEKTGDYRVALDDPEVDAVIVTTSWNSHFLISLDAMRAGKQVGCDAGGAYDIEDCWELVRTYERTGCHCMLLENCCYGRAELLTLNMVRKGLFGIPVAGEGGYRHDLRKDVAFSEEGRHYRLNEFRMRNCDNYPTHDVGPLAKVFDINRGNRMLTLTSSASGAFGMNDYARTHPDVDPAQQSMRFAQGDVVKTVIRCARGELITLTLDTTLPRLQTREFTVQGTKGAYSDKNHAVFLDSLGEGGCETQDNFDKYFEQYMHPIWRSYIESGVRQGHGGMDWLVFSAFFDGLRRNDHPVIDTYDTACWTAISALSEQSIALGGHPVFVPDFTRGRWKNRTDFNRGPYSLEICGD